MTIRPEPYTAAELRVWRARERLTQARVAALFQTSQRSISHWEAGHLPKGFSEKFERVLFAYYALDKSATRVTDETERNENETVSSRPVDPAFHV